MRTTIPASLLAFCAAAISAQATVWNVGPGRPYTTPSQVSTLVGDGDTVAIDAGIYESDVAQWSANNLVLKGIGGYAHLRARGASYGEKAIWVIAGNNTVVEAIEFSECVSPDHNGAGIRQEGQNLTVRGCFFHNNENGILSDTDSESTIIVEHCEFAENGYGDGYSHNLYIGHIGTLIFRFNFSHGTRSGHELKSRANRNYILCNRIANGPNGTASREIDLPNGGFSVIAGNEIEQGPQGENSNIIGYGFEGFTNSGRHTLLLINNTIVNDRGAGTFVALADGTERYSAWNNILAGSGTPLNGTALATDTAHNLVAPIDAAGMTDAAAGDYSLSSTSPAIEAGALPADSIPASLIPTEEYRHPVGRAVRPVEGIIDIGAHEYTAASSVASGQTLQEEDAWRLHAGSTTVTINRVHGGSDLALYNSIGQKVMTMPLLRESSHSFNLGPLSPGIYFYAVHDSNGRTLSTGQIPVR